MSEALFVEAPPGCPESEHARALHIRLPDGHREQLPLAVDLDGTLIKTDLLHESVTAALLKQPLSSYRMVGWLAKGRAHLKARLAEAVSLDASTLPYRVDLLGWLREEKAAGRRIVLATAADRSLAEEISVSSTKW